MNHFFTIHATRIRSAVILAALATSGLFTAAEAQVRPPGTGPGWPGGQVRPPGTGPDWNRNNRDYDPWGERQVLSGEVVKRYSNTEYDLRAGDGHVFRVRSDDSIYLNRGDEVRVSGDWRGSTFYSRTITLVDRDNGIGNWGDNGYWNGGSFRNRIDLNGYVSQRYGTQTFELRTASGRTYLVRGDNSTPNLRNGDRVRISGFTDGNRIRATSVINFSRNGGVVGPGGGWGNGDWDRHYPDWDGRNNDGRNNDGRNNGGWGRGNTDAGVGLDVDFPGRIESIDRTRREATVRGDNGRSYRIRTTDRNDFDNLRIGDRIRVNGVVRDDYITVQNVDRIR